MGDIASRREQWEDGKFYNGIKEIQETSNYEGRHGKGKFIGNWYWWTVGLIVIQRLRRPLRLFRGIKTNWLFLYLLIAVCGRLQIWVIPINYISTHIARFCKVFTFRPYVAYLWNFFGLNYDNTYNSVIKFTLKPVSRFDEYVWSWWQWHEN